MWRPALAIAFGILSACSGGSGVDQPERCNPLGGQGCLLPWPSAAYEVADSSTATGRRIELPVEAMPTNIDGATVDPSWFKRWDGFSPTGPMLAEFPTGVSNANLPTFKDPDASLAADAPIVLLDMETGERVPYFAEVDQNTTQIAKRNLIIRPLARLRTNARYVVAIRNSVKAADGSELPIPAAFQAALSGDGYDHPRYSSKRYDEIFAALARAGVDRNELVLAWDFHTASDEFLRRDLMTMRDAALPAIGDGASLTFTAASQSVGAGVLRGYLGTFTSPNFLTDGDGAMLRRSADGLPERAGMRDARFSALIPQCVTSMPLPRPTIVWGHGLFGSSDVLLTTDVLIQLAQEYCFVIVAGDFYGLTSREMPLAPLAANDLNKGPQIAEKLMQAVIDFIALETMVRGPFTHAPEFQYNGQSVIDPQKTFYLGGSLGGIMGNVVMAYDPNLLKGALAVPGGAWSLLFERSYAWHLLKGAAMGSYEDPDVYQLNIALLGMMLEPVDPITTAAHVIKDPLPGVPAKNILIWYTLGDSLVTNISTELLARTMGMDLLMPSVKTVWNLPSKSGPLENAVNVYDEHPSPLPSDLNVPPTIENGTHAGVDKNPSVHRQIKTFFLASEIVQTCGGDAPQQCDCATGACN